MLFQSKDPTFYKKENLLNLGGEIISLSQPKVMGILNVTPDSFFDGGRYKDERSMLKRVESMLDEGADFIDVGGFSTRPGAEDVSEAEELSRILAAVRPIRKSFPNVRLSIDTFRASVVKRIIEAVGPSIINDISGGDLDAEMFKTVADLRVPYIMMHMQGTPQNMQDNPQYDDVVKDIMMLFAEKVKQLRLLGVNDIILDPGFGFGKSVENNYELINQLDAFELFELPILVGVSRKSMIWRCLDCSAEESLNGTSVVHTLALLGGASILRVHDVKEAVECIKIVEKLKSIAR